MHIDFFLVGGIQGLTVPPVLRPYMQGREFLPWVKELPKNLQRKNV
jgi:seryl-tRNA synthetase